MHAAERRERISGSQDLCSGFMRTERRQVTVVEVALEAGQRLFQNETGRSARATCRPRLAAAEKIALDFAEAAAGVEDLGTNTSMSSSGTKAGMNVEEFARCA